MEVERGTVEGDASQGDRNVASGRGREEVVWLALPGRKPESLGGPSSEEVLKDYLCTVKER